MSLFREGLAGLRDGYAVERRYVRPDRSIDTSLMGDLLLDLARCPQCAIASPRLSVVWASPRAMPRTDGGQERWWACYTCSSCGDVVGARAIFDGRNFHVEENFPNAKMAHEDIPEIARRFLQQAFETLHAPDAAAVMAGSAVDGMLKAKGYEKGSLYNRIDKAVGDNVLTQGMADWAHEVRLGSNRPRHADVNRPHMTADEARQSVEFAEALGNFLFVLTAKIDRGIKAAKAGES